MAYSVDNDTKIATYNSATYPPTQKTNATTGETTLVAKTEAECIRVKALRDAAPTLILNRLREKRNSLLAETDWWASSDLTMTDAQRTYRQALRDITETYNSIESAEGNWPTKP